VPEMQRFVIGADDDAQETVVSVLESHRERERVAAEQSHRQLTAGPIAQAEYVRAPAGERVPLMTKDQVAKAATSPDVYVTPGTDTIPTPFDDEDPFDKAPPAAAAGPATETLFGTTEPMEPTAEEKARDDADEEARIREDDRRLLEDEARHRR
jgi:hypothetical protein